MSHFNEEQLKELESIFGLTRVVTIEALPVLDGVVTIDDEIWWGCDDVTELVKAKDHWENIRNFPFAYQRNKPVIDQIIYEE